MRTRPRCTTLVLACGFLLSCAASAPESVAPSSTPDRSAAACHALVEASAAFEKGDWETFAILSTASPREERALRAIFAFVESAGRLRADLERRHGTQALQALDRHARLLPLKIGLAVDPERLGPPQLTDDDTRARFGSGHEAFDLLWTPTGWKIPAEAIMPSGFSSLQASDYRLGLDLFGYAAKVLTYQREAAARSGSTPDDIGRQYQSALEAFWTTRRSRQFQNRLTEAEWAQRRHLANFYDQLPDHPYIVVE